MDIEDRMERVESNLDRLVSVGYNGRPAESQQRTDASLNVLIRISG